ncbi:MAG: DUF429 domain-containing protein [Dehalococcoidia bacterium]|nr:DUF429 domain-containing protein [Dehalococcoidia bacterium]
MDLAGVETRPTGMCVMDNSLRVSTCLLHGNEEIMCWTVDARPDVVAIDAPLALSRGRKSILERSDIHLRECDRQPPKMWIKFFPLTLGHMRKLTAMAMLLKALMENKGMTVVETYPGAAQDVLHIPRKGRGLDKLAESLRMIGIRGLKEGLSGDELDAVTCALVGIMYLRGDYVAIGDPDEVLMILPLATGKWQKPTNR